MGPLTKYYLKFRPSNLVSWLWSGLTPAPQTLVLGSHGTSCQGGTASQPCTPFFLVLCPWVWCCWLESWTCPGGRWLFAVEQILFWWLHFRMLIRLEMGLQCVVFTGLELCGTGWPSIWHDSPVTASWVLGLKMRTIMLGSVVTPYVVTQTLGFPDVLSFFLSFLNCLWLVRQGLMTLESSNSRVCIICFLVMPPSAMEVT